jgi:hypothetical protein
MLVQRYNPQQWSDSGMNVLLGSRVSVHTIKSLRFVLRATLSLAGVACLCAAPDSLAQEPAASGSAPPAPAATTPAPPTLDSRGRDLVKRLDLTVAQQADLAKILASERAQVRKLWRQSNIPPEVRASATRGIHEKTEDKIRELLTDEQRNKYIVHREGEPVDAAARSNVDDWFKAPKAK